MKSVTVVGAFSFIGYSLICYLLEKNIDVEGYQVALTKIEEEKMLGIGRNSYFTYIDSLEAWKKKTDIVYVCLYDEGNKYETIKEVFNNVNNTRVLIISDIYMYEKNLLLLQEVEDYVRKEAAKRHIQYAFIYVPTLYGPWQPVHLTYHQLIVGREHVTTHPRECTDDVIFVEDAASMMYALGEKKVKGESYYLTSGREGAWREGISLLGEHLFYHEEKSFILPPYIKRVTVENGVLLNEGLQIQREHIQKYSYLYRER